MAEKKTIELEIKSNVDESIAGLIALKRQLKDTAAGSEEFKKIYNQIDDLEDKIKSSKNASSDWIDSLESAGGPLGALGGSLNRAKVATQSFGGALKATGIGLIVSLIGGLVAAFNDNEVAMKKLQPLLNGISKLFQGVFRAVEPLFNTLVDLAVSALPMVSEAFGVVYSSVTAVFDSLGMIGSAIKKLISGDFSGAWKDAKSSVTDFSTNYDNSIKRFNSGTKEMTATEKEEAEKRAENRKKAQEKQDAIDLKNKEERIKKEEEERKRLEDIAKAKADAEMASAKEVMDKEKNLKESQESPAQKEEREYQEWLIKYQENNLNTELLTKIHKETLDKIMLDSYAKDADAAIASTAISTAEAEKRIATEKDEAEKRLSIKQQALNDLQTIFGTETAIGKAVLLAKQALAIQEMVMSIKSTLFHAQSTATKSTITAAGAGVDIASGAAKTVGAAPFPANIPLIIGYAATAVGIVSSIKAAMTKVKGTSAPTIGEIGVSSANATTAPSFNVVGASSTNQLAQSLGQQQNEPIKAYVVSSDVTTAQSMDRNIITGASIG
jgi:flagellar biosynthesis GTPase FlhF